MFRLLPQRELTALEREWEGKLRAAGEGPPEIRSLYQSNFASDGVAFVPLSETFEYLGNSNALPEHATAVYWRILADDVHSLPAAYPVRERAFMLCYAESGNATKARKQVGISHVTAWRYLKRFNESRKVKSDNV